MVAIEASELIDERGMEYFHSMSTFGALSDGFIREVLETGLIEQLERKEYIIRHGVPAEEFHVVLEGEVAYYKQGDGQNVLTRRFQVGEQMGFDLMLGLIPYDGTDVALQDSKVLTISKRQFYDLHVNHPEEFGIFMLNLARELSREIAILEDVVGKGQGWQAE